MRGNRCGTPTGECRGTATRNWTPSRRRGGLLISLIIMTGLGMGAGPPGEQRPTVSTSPPDSVPAALRPPPSLQGPALAVPAEILALLDQRKQALDRREAKVREAETRLMVLKREIEELLARYEARVQAEEARRRAFEAKQAATATEARQAAFTHLAKIYEAMPPEEAAARIEKMPREQALRLLRALKSKTAGAILAQVRPERAAQLTAQLVSE